MKNHTIYYPFALLLLFIFSCKGETRFLHKFQGKSIFYEIIFQDKEKKRNIYRQSYSFLSLSGKLLPAVKSDGELVFFSQDENGITKKVGDNSISKLVLAFPVEVGTTWETDDKTTLQMKLGYDRVYDTNLPFISENIIEKTNDIISINGKKIKNCIKIKSYGKTSFNPGPPLSNINIEVFSTTWFSKKLGVVKYKREERSDSETMGIIFYEKSIILDN
tara:strand:+ start:3198 stop:3854 length:657 start_codon:yes stop_codon:yes gene_type:complete